MSNIDPSFGRDAELYEYATSDLSVEEQLAGGASVDDLVAAGVLYDDYDPDNDPAYDFTPEPPKREIPVGSGMSDEEFETYKRTAFRYSNMAKEYRKQSGQLRAKGIKVDSLEFRAFTEEFQKNAERLTENASDTAI